MQKTIAQIVSVVLHPLWMPLYAALLVRCIPYVQINMGRLQTTQLFAGIVLLTIVTPAVTIFLLHRRGQITQWSIPNRNERIVPYLVTGLSYVLLCYLFSYWRMPSYIQLTGVGMYVAITLTCIINLFWKISAHLCGIGALCGATYVMLWIISSGNIALLVLLVLLSGLVAWARLVLEAHTPAQVLAGFVIGFCCGFFPVMLFYV